MPDLDPQEIELVEKETSLCSDTVALVSSSEFVLSPERSEEQSELERALLQLKPGETLEVNPLKFTLEVSSAEPRLQITYVLEEKSTGWYNVLYNGAHLESVPLVKVINLCLENEILEKDTQRDLPPGATLFGTEGSLTLPEAHWRVNPFAALRAPFVHPNREILSEGQYFLAHAGESLFGEYVAFSSLGLGKRRRNEDAFLKIDRGTGASWFFVLDGIGGNGGGRVACRVVSKSLAYGMRVGTPLEEAIENCLGALVHEHTMLSQSVLSDDEDTSGMGVCLIGTEVHAHAVRFHTIGDCVAVLYRRDKSSDRVEMLHETPMQSWAHDMWRNGEITKDEVRSHKLRHTVSNFVALSNGNAQPFEIHSSDYFEIEPDDIVIMGSDGLWDNLDPQVVQQVIQEEREPQAIARKLHEYVQLCVERVGGKDDNVTIIVYQHQL